MYGTKFSGGGTRRFAAPPAIDGPEFERVDEPLSVAELTDRIRRTLSRDFNAVRVVGEVSNLSKPRSGHAYLSLKDDAAQLSAVIWNSNFRKLLFELRDGMRVVCTGRVEVYPPQGRYQLVVSTVEPLGIGSLELAFRQLQEKLRREGLFDPARKKPLPRFIRRVGAVTSGTSAAFRDFLNVLGRRGRRIDVVLAPTRVQGEGAGANVVSALRRLDQLRDVLRLDAIALIRGGGSVEDLWTFNEEAVARAVAASTLPVVTGIGHEVDVSICDLVADVHALTPTDAAAQLTPEDDAGYLAILSDWQGRIERAVESRLRFADERLTFLEQKLHQNDPSKVFAEKKERLLADLEARLTRQMEYALESAARRTDEATAKLNALNPLAVLGRGYSLARRADDLRIVRSPSDVQSGDEIITTLANGKIRSIVV